MVLRNWWRRGRLQASWRRSKRGRIRACWRGLAPIAEAVAWKSSAAGAWLEVRTGVQGDEGKAVDEAGLSTLRARVNARLESRLRMAITSRTLPLLSTSVADGAFGSFSGASGNEGVETSRCFTGWPGT